MKWWNTFEPERNWHLQIVISAPYLSLGCYHGLGWRSCGAVETDRGATLPVRRMPSAKGGALSSNIETMRHGRLCQIRKVKHHVLCQQRPQRLSLTQLRLERCVRALFAWSWDTRVSTDLSRISLAQVAPVPCVATNDGDPTTRGCFTRMGVLIKYGGPDNIYIYLIASHNRWLRSESDGALVIQTYSPAFKALRCPALSLERFRGTFRGAFELTTKVFL